jgi:F0F1-type ATP synthase assembly protein I
MKHEMEQDKHDRAARQVNRRRWMLVILILIGLLVGALAVRWVTRELGLGRVGDFYRQADEVERP